MSDISPVLRPADIHTGWLDITVTISFHGDQKSRGVNLINVVLKPCQLGPIQGKCCHKIVRNFSLIIFWYAPNVLDPAIIRLIFTHWKHSTSDMINWKDNLAILI